MKSPKLFLAILLNLVAAVAMAAADPCTFTFDTTDAQFNTAGGSSNINVTASGTNCSWSVLTFSPFITITSATNFTGDGTVTYTVASNTNKEQHTATILMAGQIYTITQDGFGIRAGNYNGFVVQTNAPPQESSGGLNLNLKSNGRYIARLTVGGVRSTFKGNFDGAGNSTNTVTRRGLTSLQVIMQTDLFNDANGITGTVSDGVFTSEVFAVVASFSRTNRCPFQGYYTMVFAPADSSDPTVPQGYGYGTLTVSRSGRSSLRGVLGDGTKMGVSIPVSEDGVLPLFELLYKNHGSCIGSIALSTNSQFAAAVDWFKPPVATDRFYTNGFTTALMVTGAVYVSPFSKGPPLPQSGTVTLGGGNLAGNIMETVAIDSNGIVTVTSTNANDKLAVQLVPATGQFSGSFLDAGINQTFTFNGSLVQTNYLGAGVFLGTNESGFVTFDPGP